MLQGLAVRPSRRGSTRSYRMARHCSTLFADDTHFVARMKGLRQYNPGQLGDRVCFHCGALLFVAESRVVPRPAWQVRHAAYVNANAAWAVDRDDWRAKLASHVIPRRYEGVSCCRGGRVVLPPMRTSPVVEELFRGATPRSRVFRQYTRKINNAMAFASEKGSMKVARGTYPSNTTRAPQPGGAADPSQPHMHNGRGVRPTLPRGHAPDYMVCGKLYHFVGPLLPAPGVPSAFAQLYVHDPTALDDVVSERFNHIPLSRDDAKNPRVHGHLLAIVRALHEEMFRVNPYASDFKMAADIFREQEVTNAVFVIDADKAPVDAPTRLYNNPATGALDRATAIRCRSGRAVAWSFIVRLTRLVFCAIGNRQFKEVSVFIVDPLRAATQRAPPVRSVILRPRALNTMYPFQSISETHRAYTALHFPLLYPLGDNAWTITMSLAPEPESGSVFDRMDDAGIVFDTWDPYAHKWVDAGGAPAPPTLQNRRISTTKVTPLMYHAYRAHQRGVGAGIETMFLGGRLYQEHLCMAYSIVETQNLFWVKKNQKALRAECYGALKAAVGEADTHNHSEVPCGVVLPSSFQGGARDKLNRFHDAMATVAQVGKPSLFITFTAKAAWDAIMTACNGTIPKCTPSTRDDLVARVFHLMLKELLRDLNDRHVLGRTVAYMHVIEFQQRGYPHAHILVVFDENDRVNGAHDVDDLVSAELPTLPVRSSYRAGVMGDRRFARALEEADRLTALVCKTMLHRECGPGSDCYDAEKCACKNMFPKPFNEHTKWDDNKIYPVYRRRSPAQGGRSFEHLEGTKLRMVTNQWVIPYNGFLLLKYGSHINVEVGVTSFRG